MLVIQLIKEPNLPFICVCSNQKLPELNPRTIEFDLHCTESTAHGFTKSEPKVLVP